MMNRRGFFAGLLGGAAALQGILTGATPPVLPQAALIPVDPKRLKLYEFLQRMFLEDKEFFLEGDIGGFTQSFDMQMNREAINVTCYGDAYRRFMPGLMRVKTEIVMPLESPHGVLSEFKLEAEVTSARPIEVVRGSIVNPRDLPRQSCMIPFGPDFRETVVFNKSRFFVRSMNTEFLMR